MNLCIDVGNTRIKVAAFSQTGELLELAVHDNWPQEALVTMIEKYNCQAGIVSSVRENAQEQANLLQTYLQKVCLLTADLPTPIQNQYKTPKTLGKDRLAAVVGATKLLPQKNVLVVDAGTCITYDFVTAANVYHGGSILPGIDMRFKSMHHFTAKLPLVQRTTLTHFIGNTTQTALQTGVLFGVLHELRGFRQQYEAQFGDIAVIVTGGDASYFESQLKSEIFAQPNLVLIGLNQILNYNTDA